VSAGASLGLFAFSWISGRYVAPATEVDWWSILAMGIGTAGAFVCLLGALQRIGAVRTAIISATEPLSAALLAWLFLDESVSPGTALGGALILAGAVAASLARRAPDREQQVP
jgi:drug/metabolite transporter (DMT)-like permease